jgi:hypothetical protein
LPYIKAVSPESPVLVAMDIEEFLLGESGKRKP